MATEDEFDPLDDCFISAAYDQYTSALPPLSPAILPLPSSSNITNKDIIDRYLNKESWQEEADWLSDCCSVKVSAKLVRTDWTRLYNRYRKLRYSICCNQKETFLCRPYHVPGSSSSLGSSVAGVKNSTTSSSSSSSSGSKSATSLSHGSSSVVLETGSKTFSFASRDSSSALSEACSKSSPGTEVSPPNPVRDYSDSTNETSKQVLGLARRLTHVIGELENKNKLLQKARHENARLKRHHHIYNTGRKLKRRDALITELSAENKTLSNKVKTIENRCKRLMERCRYSQVKIRRMEDQVKNKKAEVRNKAIECDQLRSTLEEVTRETEIETFRDGRYTNDIRLVVYDLLSKGVSSANVSGIIKTVLQTLCNTDASRLPKGTVVKYMAAEAGLLAKAAAAARIDNSSTATLHTDGTTKHHEKYQDFVSTTDSGQVGLSVTMEASGDTKTQITATTTLFAELADILSKTTDNCDKKLKADELLAKHQCMMTDRHIVNKCYADWLHQWRQEVLPTIQENWDILDQNSKDTLVKVFDFYCGNHLLLGVQNNIDSTICDWEKVEASGRKIGRQNIMLYAASDSCTMCAIRSVCKAFGPDASESAGHPMQFAAFIQDRTHFVPFRGNRFNVPFVNASATYHHRLEILRYIDSIPQAEKNRLLQAIEADLQDPIIIAGIRCMSVMERIITSPLMKMINSDIHILDTNTYYTSLHDKLEEWAEHPETLLSGTSSLFLNYPSVQDNLWTSIFQDDITDEIKTLTEYCASLSLLTTLMTVERMVVDHLPGGKYDQPENSLKVVTSNVPKHNNCAEHLFSGLDRLKRSMPNSLCVTVEGILLFAMNKPKKFYITLDDTKKAKLMTWIRKKARDKREEDRNKRTHIKQLQHQQLIKKQQDKERKDSKKDAYDQTVEKTVYHKYGGPCRSKSDVLHMIRGREKKDALEAVKFQIRYAKSLRTSSKMDKTLFAFSKKGKEHSLTLLKQNLISIVSVIYQDDEDDNLPLINFVDSDDDLPLAQLCTDPEYDIPLANIARDEKRRQLTTEVRQKLQKQRDRMTQAEL